MLIVYFMVSSPLLCFAIVNIDNMKKIADGGNSYAQYEVGKYYYESGNKVLGSRYLNMACDGQYNPACEYLNKNNDFPKENINNFTFEEGLKFYDNKEYKNAFLIFENLCDNYKSKGACFMLGICYRFGEGTRKNTSKALNIFSSPTFESDENAHLQQAYIYEFDEGNSYSINKAKSIYSILKNSPDKKVAERASKGLERNYIYSFLEKVFIPYNSFFKDKIEYDALERHLMSVDTSKIPSELKNTYLSWRLPFLKLASNKRTLGDTAWEIGKSALKGFLLDFSFVTDALDSWNKDEKLKPLITEERHYYSLLVDQLQQLNISAKFWNSLHGQ